MIDPAAVQSLANTTCDVSFYVSAAENLLKRLSCMSSYSQETRDEIGTLIAAHMFEQVHPSVVKSEKIGDAAVTYATNTTKDGMASTLFGQQALLLDTAGCLQYLGKKRLKVYAVGPTARGSIYPETENAT